VARGTVVLVLLMMLVGWLALALLALPFAAALGHAARLQDREARRAAGFVPEAPRIRVPV